MSDHSLQTQWGEGPLPLGIPYHILKQMEDHDIATLGYELGDIDDRTRWLRADLVVEFFARHDIIVLRGRPPEGYDGPTRDTLANAWNISTRRVSDFYLNGIFYPQQFRRLNPKIGWTHYAAARRHVCRNNRDWLTDKHYHSVLLLRAMGLIRHAWQNHMSVNEFADYLRSKRKSTRVVLFQGRLPDNEPPPAWVSDLARRAECRLSDLQITVLVEKDHGD